MIALVSVLCVFNISFGGVNKIDTLTITDSSIVINQHIVLSFPLSVDTLESILGTSRKSKTKSEFEQNDIYFWDKLGVMVYCPKHIRNISSVDICYRRSFWRETRRMFKGVVIIGNRSIHKNMSRADFEDLGFSSASFPNSIFDEHRTLDLLELRINAEFKEHGGKFIGFGIFSRKY